MKFEISNSRIELDFPISNSAKKNKEAQILSPDLPACPAGKKRFLISGAAGFISSHLVEALLKQKYQVIGLDNFI